MLNEYELSAWAVWLDCYQLDNHPEYSVEDLINFTSLVIKLSLNDEDYLQGMFTSYFNTYIRGFISKLNNWVRDDTNEFHFDPIKVNQKFSLLNKPYNPSVDQEFIDFNN